MYGRYGIDSLGKFLVIAGIIAMLIAGWTDSLTLVTLSWALIIYAYFRVFSRNIYKRSAENQWYLNKTYKLRTTTFINARSANKKSAFPAGKDASRSAAPGATPHSSRKVN